ncbi:MAG TPA: hypothetical protein V6D05_11730 [Stenomitos sp.]
MQEPSIRSFTLDYYRSLGAELTPLDPGARSWEIRLPQKDPAGKALNITFDPNPDDSQVRPMGRTTPQWRAILEACTQARPVAYRHIVTEPIHHASELFAARLPGFGVKGAQLVSVRPRTAVGFSHRVTFDAPAMAARHEELHHDLLDALTGERLDALSETFYTLPAIPIDPPRDPRNLAIETLHVQAIAHVDARTEERGNALEAELSPRLKEAEERIALYYAGQVAQLLKDEEAELDAKLEHLVRRTQETKLPGAITKLQAEAEKVTLELEQIRIRRELEGEGIREAERARLEAERARHEITLETTLVSVAFVTYDVVTYALELEQGTLEITYVPVTHQLSLPNCPRCGLAIAHGEGAPPPGGVDGRVVCHRCVPGTVGEAAQAAKRVAEPCSRCGVMTPHEAIQRCHLTGAAYCVVCAVTCHDCGEVTARELLRPNPSGRGMVCPDHTIRCNSCHLSVLPRETFTCPACKERHCHSHSSLCPDCGMPTCIRCAREREGHCGACSALKRIRSDHDLVRVVHELLPSLKRLGLGWRLAEVGEYALLEWRAPLGRRGRLILSTQDYFLVSQRERGLLDRTWR